MSRIVLVALGGLLAAGLCVGASAPAAAGKKVCYTSSASAGWFNEKSAASSSVRRLNHAIDAEAHKRKWKVVYVSKTATSCSKSGNAWYKCTSKANVCSSK